MKALHKSFWMLALLGLIVSSFVTSGLAQVAPPNPANPTTLQSRNFQAGTVNDPGSSLIYLIDSGVRPISTAAGATVLAQMQAAPFNLTDGATAASAYKNLVSITNTNPTSAVTVHFRYFSDMCTDLLDFLVVLSVNDVLMFDPFNFVIPGTTLNVRTRLFGPATTISGVTIGPITPSVFGSGRFLLFATASGVDNDGDSQAEIQFPFGTSADGAAAGLIGTTNSLSPSTRANLNPLNASAMSFNWLIGSQTIAINAQFNTDLSADNRRDQVSFGNVAWARPAVDIAFDVSDGYPDADGNPVVADGLILTGGETEVGGGTDGGGVLIPTAVPPSNTLALRGEINSGRYSNTTTFSATVGNQGLSTLDNTVLANAGAIAWNVIFPSELTAGAPREGSLPENQWAEFVSVADDYNGSKNGSTDRSYNLMPTRSHYQMDIYNNNELRLGVSSTVIPISPPSTSAAPGLGITVECISVGLGIQAFTTTTGTTTTNQALVKTGAQTNLTPDGRLRISDLNTITGADGTAVVRLHIDDPVQANDVSAGWIRFNRIRTRLIDQSAATSVFGYDGVLYPVFFNTARFAVGFEGFGAGWWLFGVRERAGATP